MKHLGVEFPEPNSYFVIKYTVIITRLCSKNPLLLHIFISLIFHLHFYIPITLSASFDLFGLIIDVSQKELGGASVDKKINF